MATATASMEFFHTHISPRAAELAGQVLRSGWINEGPMVRRFEEALGVELGIQHPVAVNSCTAALHLALVLAGVGPGDEVILPAQTFVATGLVVLHQRATPVFADIDPRTGNLSVESIREHLTGRTRAILAVHWGGYPCDLGPINQLASERGLAVVEDAAHALGGTYQGRPLGAISRFTAFSFQAIKHLTTGDGGALGCREEADYRAAARRRWFGIDRQLAQPSPLGERIYDVEEVGYKYHMNDLAAAVGLGNLERFPERLARRRAIGERYRRELAGVAGLELLEARPDRAHAYWLFTILVERRLDFIRLLAEKGIPASVVHLRIDKYGVFGGPRPDLAGQADFDQRQVAIPLHEALSDEEIGEVIRTIRSGW